jgi:hypothetical protein
MSNPNNEQNVITKGFVEFATVGTLATLVTTTLPGVACVTVATLGGSALIVSLPAVVAVAAAVPLGLSLGDKLRSAINDNTGKSGNTKAASQAKA